MANMAKINKGFDLETEIYEMAYSTSNEFVDEYEWPCFAHWSDPVHAAIREFEDEELSSWGVA